MVKLGVFYNTCGISGKDNVDYYIKGIESLLNQTFQEHRVVLSSCLNKPEDITKLKNHFGNKIDYSIINEKHTVNITFNKSVQEFVKRHGQVEGYLYIDSGCIADDGIHHIYELFKSDKYGIVSGQPSNDSALDHVFGLQYQDEIDMIIPIGKSINLHYQIFHNDIYKLYNRLIPDIFRSFCTESTFGYLCASVNREWFYTIKAKVQHARHLDGPSSGFNQNTGWWDVFGGHERILAVINDPEAHECGFGYEECNGVKMHNKDVYEDGLCKDPQRLAKFILRSIFLDKSELNYDNIACEYESS